MATRSTLLSSPKQRQGGDFEALALAYLQAQGLTLVAKNWLQPKVGELDLVMIEPKRHARGWEVLVFIEVRQRKASGFGDAISSVTPAKQRKLIKTGRYFLQQHPQYADYECRFDVVGFTASADHLNQLDQSSQSIEPEWVQGAFVAQAW